MSVSETSESYPVIWLDENAGLRLIRCKDDIQWIVQLRRSSRWRNKTFHTDTTTIFRDHPALDLVAVREAIARDSNQSLMRSQRPYEAGEAAIS